jgi:hypothetical protein
MTLLVRLNLPLKPTTPGSFSLQDVYDQDAICTAALACPVNMCWVTVLLTSLIVRMTPVMHRGRLTATPTAVSLHPAK